MRALVAACVLFALTATARASGDVGVVVIGDAALQPDVSTYLEAWLRDHGHALVTDPLSEDATHAVASCLLADDDGCAAGVIDKRGHARSIVFARVSKTGRAITIDAYWFVQGKAPVGEHRVCDDCSQDGWHGVADLLMGSLAGASSVDIGRIAVDSTPSGLLVLLDHVRVGVTPLERDVPTGRHEITLMHAGHRVGDRRLTVARGATAHVSIQADDAFDTPHTSHVPGALLLGAGVATAATGGVFLYYGSIGGNSQKYVYPDSTPVGIGLATVGIGAGIVGVILLSQAGHHAAPIASLGPHGGYIGWITRF